MKKINLFAMSLLATAAFTFYSCSNDDTMSSTTTSQQESVNAFYMTLQVKGSANGTRTEQQADPNKENGTTEESTITNGTVYIYDGASLVFKKDLTASDWSTAPSQTATGTTKPIKVSVNSVAENTNYNVYFLANYSSSVADPINNDALFNVSATGGLDYATDNKFVMFNQNDKSKTANHSTVKFEATNKNEATPAQASTIYMDRVVARIDAPTVTATAIATPQDASAGEQTKHIEYIASVSYVDYAVSNLNNHSYVMQKWTVTNNVWTLNTAASTNSSVSSYYKNYATYGTKYEAKGLDNFGTTAKNYMFENTTNDADNATAVYFRIKANLSDDAKALGVDFEDGTFYRYDNRVYTSIEAIQNDNEVAYPFVKVNADKSTTAMTPAEVLAIIKGTDGKLIAEGTTLANFRQKYNIEVYREGNMYYRYAINDNWYTPTGYYSILRNSIYRLTVDAIYNMGKDVPNGPDIPDVTPNYYMNVTVGINPWVLNTQTIQF